MWCSHLDGQITEVMGEIQKVEGKLAQLKETMERQKVDIRSLERDKQAKSRAFEPKVGATHHTYIQWTLDL